MPPIAPVLRYQTNLFVGCLRLSGQKSRADTIRLIELDLSISADILTSRDSSGDSLTETVYWRLSTSPSSKDSLQSLLITVSIHSVSTPCITQSIQLLSSRDSLGDTVPFRLFS